MRIRFIKETKDTREGATASFREGWSGIVSNEMARSYIDNGDAIEVGVDLSTGKEIKKVKKKVKKDKIENDGEV
jgi:hypothetical protein